LIAGLLFLVAATTQAQSVATPEMPPVFVTLTKVEKLTITFVFWQPEVQFVAMSREITENGEKRTVVMNVARIVPQPREATMNQSDVTGTTVAGEPISTGKAWKSRVGKSMLMLDKDAPLDPAYQATLAPDTVVLKLNAPLPRLQAAPNPDGSPSTAPVSGGPSANTAQNPNPSQNPNPAPNPTTTNPIPAGPSPQELASAQQAIQPELVRLKIKVAPQPFTHPDLQSALPGYMFFPVDSDETDPAAKSRGKKLVVKKPDGTPTTLGEEESVFDLLREEFTVLTEADARKYVRTHLLLVEARYPQFTYGPIAKINVESNGKGGLTASGEAPILSGGNEARRPLAFTLNVNFNREGKPAGGKRGARFE